MLLSSAITVFIIQNHNFSAGIQIYNFILIKGLLVHAPAIMTYYTNLGQCGPHGTVISYNCWAFNKQGRFTTFSKTCGTISFVFPQVFCISASFWVLRAPKSKPIFLLNFAANFLLFSPFFYLLPFKTLKYKPILTKIKLISAVKSLKKVWDEQKSFLR